MSWDERRAARGEAGRATSSLLLRTRVRGSRASSSLRPRAGPGRLIVAMPWGIACYLVRQFSAVTSPAAASTRRDGFFWPDQLSEEAGPLRRGPSGSWVSPGRAVAAFRQIRSGCRAGRRRARGNEQAFNALVRAHHGRVITCGRFGTACRAGPITAARTPCGRSCWPRTRRCSSRESAASTSGRCAPTTGAGRTTCRRRSRSPSATAAAGSPGTGWGRST